ncbi:MAG: hypothetical protein KGI67_00605 [Pseudomonadota bacterium]|nr:hypothetical protein [Pseudomonadota bacterium]
MTARRPLARRLLFTMLPWYLIPAMALTGAQIALQYHSERAAVRADLAALARTIEPGVAAALWQLDRPQLELMASALLGSSRISGVMIEDERGAELARSGQLPALPGAAASAIELPIWYQPTAPSSRLIGHLHLYASDDLLWRRIRYSALSVVAQSLLMAAGLWLIVTLTVRLQLVRDLQALARAVSGRRFDVHSAPPAPIAYGHDDELGDLVQALNRSESGLHAAMSEVDGLNRSLEAKVAQRTGELQLAKDVAESADRTKSAFLSTMSHELRTPLNSIIGFTGILLQGLAGPLNAEQGKQLGMVRGSARHLLALINDVLDISRIEAGRLAVAHDTYDLAAILQQAVATITPLAERKGLVVSADIAPELGTAQGDARRVRQVLLNLLGNAVKFTETGGIRLQARLQVDAHGSSTAADSDPGAHWTICQGNPAGVARPAALVLVEDSGIGIRQQDLGSLFQPFQQIDATLARSHEGSGLGLAICARLVVLMGGAIAADSRWQSGTRFQVWLPLQPSPEETRA